MNYSYNLEIESAYIIVLRGNEISEKLAQRCIKSCDEVGISYKIWYGFDGTGGNIITPDHLNHKEWLSWLKVMNQDLSPSSVGCSLSHFSLWCHCIELDRPIVILEHDAIVIKPILGHQLWNSIIYLGCSEQVKNEFPVTNIPPLYLYHSCSYRYMCRTHSYSIDPAIAKNLVSHMIKFGIYSNVDEMIRSDIFSICQNGLYAYDGPSETTIEDNRA